MSDSLEEDQFREDSVVYVRSSEGGHLGAESMRRQSTSRSSLESLRRQSTSRSSLSPRAIATARGADWAVSDPQFVRAVDAKFLLRRFGSIFRGMAGSNTFGLSRPVNTIDVFVSHAWMTSGLLKTVAMMYHLNAWRAVVAAFVVAIATIIRRTIWCCTAGTLFIAIPSGVGETAVYDINVLHLLIPFIVFLVGIVYGQEIPGLPNRKCFLDKCCINQSDDVIKMKGIRQLGGFLVSTRKFLVLWQPVYFKRLWCVYELAAFHFINKGGDGDIDILPLKIPLVALSLSLFHVLASMALLVLASFLIFCENNSHKAAVVVPPWAQPLYVGGIVSVSMLFCVFLLPSFLLLNFCKMHMRDRRYILEQLRSFRVEEATCRELEDREFILGKIESWFGSLRNFEQVVHEEVAGHVKRRMEEALPLPWTTVFVGSLSNLLLCLSALPARMVDGDWSLYTRIACVGLMVTCCTDALAFRFGLYLAEHGLGCGTRVQKFLEPLALATCFATLTGSAVSCFSLVVPLALVLPYAMFLVLATWLLYGGSDTLQRLCLRRRQFRRWRDGSRIIASE